MTRRVRTLLVSGMLFLTLFALSMTLHVPYVELSPGPTYNTLGSDSSGNVIIVIHGAVPKQTAGNLNMTTVDVSTRPLTAFAALSGWLQHDAVVVPHSAIYPPGQSQKQVDKENAQDFASSQDNAIAAASCELGYPGKFGVATVESGSPAKNILQPSDVLLTFDGQPATSNDQLQALLAKQTPGSVATIGISRAAVPMTVSVTLAQPAAGRTGGRIGIGVGTICATPFTVDLGLGNQIGGPSAGLMFALGIMDKVGTVDLTGGRFIAGTGTIDPGGNVGPIGGIQLKMIAARRAGATVFLAPQGNCSDVQGAIPGGLQVVKIGTLHDAVIDLEALKTGQSVPHC